MIKLEFWVLVRVTDNWVVNTWVSLYEENLREVIPDNLKGYNMGAETEFRGKTNGVEERWYLINKELELPIFYKDDD